REFSSTFSSWIEISSSSDVISFVDSESSSDNLPFVTVSVLEVLFSCSLLSITSFSLNWFCCSSELLSVVSLIELLLCKDLSGSVFCEEDISLSVSEVSVEYAWSSMLAFVSTVILVLVSMYEFSSIFSSALATNPDVNSEVVINVGTINRFLYFMVTSIISIIYLLYTYF